MTVICSCKKITTTFMLKCGNWLHLKIEFENYTFRKCRRRTKHGNSFRPFAYLSIKINRIAAAGGNGQSAFELAEKCGFLKKLLKNAMVFDYLLSPAFILIDVEHATARFFCQFFYRFLESTQFMCS